MAARKKMKRRADATDDDVTQSMVRSIVAQSQREEDEFAENDSPFRDDDGDLYVVPTMEELSGLVEDASAQALPVLEIMRRQLKMILRAAEVAEIAYHACPKQGTSVALTGMHNLAKDLIQAMEDRRDPSVLCDEIMEAVIKPIVMEFVKLLTSEAARKRSSFMALVPPQQARVVDHEMKDLLAGVSKGCDEAMNEGKRHLEELLGARLKGK